MSESQCPANEHDEEKKRVRNESTSDVESLAPKSKKAKLQYYSIISDGDHYYLEGQLIMEGSKVDAWFDDQKRFFCGKVEGFTKKGRARLFFAFDNTRNTYSTRLRLCRCSESAETLL